MYTHDLLNFAKLFHLLAWILSINDNCPILKLIVKLDNDIGDYTDIISFDDFIKFLEKIYQKNDILITTGLIDFSLIDDLKSKYFTKVNDKIFIKKNGDKSIYLVYKPLFEDLESLLRNSKTLIACHGAITHAANSFNVKKLDILEKSKANFYNRFTSYLTDYHTIYRSNFNSVKSEIYKKILNF